MAKFGQAAADEVEARAGEGPPEDAAEPELKGSIGEGPNHSNFSDRSSVRILSKRIVIKNFR